MSRESGFYWLDLIYTRGVSSTQNTHQKKLADQNALMGQYMLAKAVSVNTDKKKGFVREFTTAIWSQL